MTGSTTKNLQRYDWVDAVKCLAAFSIVACHCIEYLYEVNAAEALTLSSTDQIFSVMGFTFGRMGVMLFLMISGFLLFQKNITDDKSVLEFLKKSFIPILTSFVAWSAIYYFFFIKYINIPFSIYEFFWMVTLGAEVPMKNMWFSPLIIAIYFAVPFWALFVKKLSFKIMLIPIIAVVMISYVFSDFNTFQQLRQGTLMLKSMLNVSLIGGNYGVLLFLGYYIGTSTIKLKRILFALFAVALYAGIVLMTLYFYDIQFDYRLWYTSTPLLLLCLSTFVAFKDLPIKDGIIKKFMRLVSGNTLGIFFIHLPIIMLLDRLNLEQTLNRPKTALVYFAVSFSVSLVLSKLLSKIPFIRKYIILSK